VTGTPIDPDFVARRTLVVPLRDGAMILLRPVKPDDKDAFRDGFARLSPASRYQRFLSPIDELDDEMLAYLTEVDYVDHFAWVALLDEPGDVDVGVGVARYVRLRDEPDVAEAAVTVVDEWQGRGLGTLLVDALGAVALENGIRTIRGYVLEDNKRMREVLDAAGAWLSHDSPGLLRVEVDVAARAEQVRGTPLGAALEALARGEGSD
jgi:RimJ/RimL family protein N-acetyltransferase